MEDQRLDVALQVIWPKVLEGDLAAIDRFLAIATRRAKLWGLDGLGLLKVLTDEQKAGGLSEESYQAFCTLLGIQHHLALAESSGS